MLVLKMILFSVTKYFIGDYNDYGYRKCKNKP